MKCILWIRLLRLWGQTGPKFRMHGNAGSADGDIKSLNRPPVPHEVQRIESTISFMVRSFSTSFPRQSRASLYLLNAPMSEPMGGEAPANAHGAALAEALLFLNYFLIDLVKLHMVHYTLYSLRYAWPSCSITYLQRLSFTILCNCTELSFIALQARCFVPSNPDAVSPLEDWTCVILKSLMSKPVAPLFWNTSVQFVETGRWG